MLLWKTVILVGIVVVFNLQMFGTIPYQRCSTNVDCEPFCSSYGYNRSECPLKMLRLNRYCECHDCDFVHCATYCTKNSLKFVGCSCFVLPTIVGQANSFSATGDGNQLLNNECYDSKFYCQCSK